MSDVPVNIVEVRMIDAAPDGGGGSDFGPMLEALRGIQINVGNINNNVRAILEVLRRCCSGRGGGGALGPRPSGGGSTAATGSARRLGSRMRFAADLMEYRTAVRRGAALGDVMRPEHSELLARFRADREAMSGRELRAAMKLRSIDLMGEGIAGRATAAAERQALRDAMRAQREQARAARAEQTATLRTARNRMANSMANRVDELRRRARMPGMTPAGLGLTPEEQAVMSGQASPSGLPGTRAHFRSIRGIVDPLRVANAPPTAPPAAAPRMTLIGGVMQIVTAVGRVLSVGTLIFGLVSKIMGALKALSQAAMQERSLFSRIDPVFATMEAQYMIGNLKAQMNVARNPAVRASAIEFTQAQLARQQAQVPLRIFGSTIRNKFASQYERAMLGVELMFGGMLTGSGQSFSQGFGLMITSALTASPGTSVFGQYLGQLIQSSILRSMMAQTATSNAMFVAPLEQMTSGRFSTRQPYMGRGATAANWWTARP
jgi:hypothetical protein